MNWTEEEYAEYTKNHKKKAPQIVNILPPKQLEFFIPHKFTTLNDYIEAERTHRQKAAKIKKAETEFASNYFRLVEKIEKRVRIKFVWHNKNMKQDPDNIAYARKFLLDGMVLSGLIENDGQKQIKGFTDDFVIDKDEGVEIEIQEVD